MPTTDAPRIPTARLAAGVLLLTLGSLLTELSLTRVFSVLMWYHLAFLAISLAMVGLSAGAVSVYVFPRLSGGGRERVGGRLATTAALAGLCTAAALLLMLRVRLTEQVNAATLVRVVLVCVLGALPFLFIGFTTSLAIREAGAKVSLVYGADLVGAALGCLLFVPAVDRLGAPLTILAGGVGCAVAALLFAPPVGRMRLACAATVALLAAGGAALDRFGFLEIDYAKGHERHDLAVRWNAFSRVAVWERPTERSFTAGISDTYTKPIEVERLVIDIDAGANTPILAAPRDPSDLEFLSHDLTGLPFTVVRPRRTLVIGPGGGRDVVLALREGSQQVTAVEINPDIVDLVRNEYGEYSGRIYDRPGVEVVVRDGRSFIQSDARQYDLIMLSLVDTFAASAAGAMSLTENMLYTREAFDAYLARLTPGGAMAFTRWVWNPERETLRIVALARASLERAGVTDPGRHILVASQNNLGCTVISRAPLTDGQIARARAKVEAMGFKLLYAPGATPDDLPATGPIAELATTRDPAGFYATYPFDVRPPTDNRPFFFFTLRPRDVLSVLSMSEGRAQNIGVLIVATVAVAVAAMALAFVVGPLLLRGGLSAVRGRLPFGAFVLYFLALGAGFMLVEIPMMQGFTLFLGQPSASLSVVLFSLLLGGGLGSFWTRTWPERPRVLRIRLALAGLGMLALLGVILWASHGFLPARAGWGMPTKVLLTVALVTPLGVCMGTFFPTGLRVVAARDERLVPWAVGLNAVASVLGSVLALMIAITAGLWQAAAAGVVVYAVVLLLFIRLTRGSDGHAAGHAVA
jgi:spermidine synthase